MGYGPLSDSPAYWKRTRVFFAAFGTTWNGMPYFVPKSGCTGSSRPIARTIASEPGRVGSPSTRWFHGFEAGNTMQPAIAAAASTTPILARAYAPTRHRRSRIHRVDRGPAARRARRRGHRARFALQGPPRRRTRGRGLRRGGPARSRRPRGRPRRRLRRRGPLRGAVARRRIRRVPGALL